ncbi:LysR family transcriptional regulator [Chitinophaga polysaccharea]|uniref:LysR family transcriptional regulator n=1 Tax=Chitinophaga TaxID=79328 RepID=UPI0014555C44|nr:MULTISPECIES: LysR family transcriptional regulator [Chitinophaga]NLR59644.1 LysR family transcriptional regulator [Chitinophaga polysaccharea]NLU93997.1 LysR family transcriptional regulator [Chitinophaga sp. Ak27]
MPINFEWFRTFKTIYETGSLTATAQALFISQPGVSLHLNSLEAYVGYKLFDRTARKMVPTERAKVFYNFILEAVNKLEQAEEHFHKSAEDNRSTISIGMCLETFQFTLEQYIATLPFNINIKFGEYPDMQQDLDHGLLDLIIAPHKSNQANLEYKAFAKEKIVLVGGGMQDIQPFTGLILANKIEEAERWLKGQTWYTTAADMENMRRFWYLNFNRHPDFRPNYIVPNKCSIVRCLIDGKGFAIIPDFLCRHELATGKLKLTWEGNNVMENTLYFGTRKKTMYSKEIGMIEALFEEQSSLFSNDEVLQGAV